MRPVTLTASVLKRLNEVGAKLTSPSTAEYTAVRSCRNPAVNDHCVVQLEFTDEVGVARFKVLHVWWTHPIKGMRIHEEFTQFDLPLWGDVLNKFVQASSPEEYEPSIH